MQDTERQKFEDNWKSAFDGAEMTPPDRVWSSIELDLVGQESAVMKKRVVFYQRLAAATVLFALMIGVYAFYPKEETKQLAVNNNEQQAPGNEKGADEKQNTRTLDTQTPSTRTSKYSGDEASVNGERQALNAQGASDIKQQAKNAQVASGTERKFVTQKISRTQQQIQNFKLESQYSKLGLMDQQSTAITSVPDHADVAENTSIAPNLAQDLSPSAEEEKKSEAVASPLLAENLLAEEEDVIVEPRKDKKKRESLWVAVGAAAGNYTPNTPSASAASAQTSLMAGPTKFSMAQQQAQSHDPKVGTAYSFGMTVGKRLGRVVFQTGVSLGKQQVDYVSNYTTTASNNSSKAAVSDYLASDSGPLSFTSDYTVNSTMEIVSVPVTAGYIIVDRRIGWQINAGVAPDFFIKNTLVDKSGRVERFTQSAGSESPYRTVNWSGLANTELSYRIGDHYRVSLVPGVRYSFNPILKESTGAGRPVIMDVGFRFKYLFN